MDRRTFIKTAAVGSVALMAGDLAIAAPEPIKYDFIEPRLLSKILNIKIAITPPESCNQFCSNYECVDYNHPRETKPPLYYKENYPSGFVNFMEVYLPMCRISNMLRIRNEHPYEDGTWVILNESEMDLFNYTLPEISMFEPKDTGHPWMKYWGACCSAWPLYTHKYWPSGWFLLGRGKTLNKKLNKYGIIKVIRKK